MFEGICTTNRIRAVPDLKHEADDGSPGLPEPGHLQAALLQHGVPAAQVEAEAALSGEFHRSGHPAERKRINIASNGSTESPQPAPPMQHSPDLCSTLVGAVHP